MSASWLGKSTGLKQLWQFHLKHVPGTIAVLPVLFALAAGSLLAFVGQMQEIYLGIIERNEWVKFFSGYALLMCLSIALHSFYLAQTRDAVPRVFGNTTNVGPNPILARFRHVIAAMCGLAPQLGLLWGVWAVQDILQIVADGYYEATGETAAGGALRIPFHDSDTDDKVAVHDIIRSGYFYLLWCLAGIFLYIGRASVLLRSARRFVKERTRRRGAICIGLAILTTALVVLPLLPPDELLIVSQGLGALAMTALQLTAVFVLLAWFVICSRWVQLAVVTLSVISLLVTAYSPLPVPTAGSGNRLAAAGSAVPPPLDLEQAFQVWLKSRAADREKFGANPFPVFIVSTQGGGIYAASAAATFLATLQSRNPAFSRHLFAISGVSGGAVGSTIFHAAIKEGLHAREASAASSADPMRSGLFAAIRGTLAQDHLSPVLGLVVADYVEKLFPWLSIRRLIGRGDQSGRIDRASALEISLTCAFDQQVRRIKSATPPTPAARTSGTARCNYGTITGGLRTPFAAHSPGEDAPSLVLNTTFSQTGKRVAFANFALQAAGEGALHSFQDLNFKRSDGSPNLNPATTLVTAAVASARFPVLMPAFVVTAVGGKNAKTHEIETKRWNFVDGGYADNSGVASAAAIMTGLQKLAAANKVELKLLILTDDNRERRPIDQDGTSLVDTRAPLDALLNVRASISSREVRLAEDRFKPDKVDAPWRVKTFRLDQENFSLQLGWNISNAKNYFVSLFTTTSQKDPAELRTICSGKRNGGAVPLLDNDGTHAQASQVKEDARTITQNRCNMQAVLDILAPR